MRSSSIVGRVVAPVAMALLLQMQAPGAAAAGGGAPRWSAPAHVLTLKGTPLTMSPLVVDGGEDYMVAQFGNVYALVTNAGGGWRQYPSTIADAVGTNSEGYYWLAVSGAVAYIAYVNAAGAVKVAYDARGPAHAWTDVTVVAGGAQCGPGQEAKDPVAAVVGGALAVAWDDNAPCHATTRETNDVYVATAPLNALTAGGSPTWKISRASLTAVGGVMPAVAADGTSLDLTYQSGGDGGAIEFIKGTPGGPDGFTWSASPRVAATVSNQGMDRSKMTLAAARGTDVTALGAGGNVVDTWVATNASGSWNAANLYRNNATGNERPTAAVGVCGPAVAYTQIPQQNATQAHVMVATLVGGRWRAQSVGAAEQSLNPMWPGIAATPNGFELVWVDDDSGSPVLYESRALCPPVVTGVSPATGPAAGGTAITVTGRAFSGASAVDFGSGRAASRVRVVSPTRITLISPAGTGTVNVTVTTPGGTSASVGADHFTYVTPAGGFKDLGGYSWAAPAIGTLAKQGVVKGTRSGAFDPQGSVTRAQFAALMQRVFKLGAPAKPVTFTDVPRSFWGYAAVEAASPYFDYFQVPGGGYAFHPNTPFDRLDVATVIVRLLAASGKLSVLGTSEAQAVLSKLTDASSIAPSLRGYVATAIKAGIMSGFPDGSFQPQRLLNRAQVAVVMLRLENQFATANGS